MRTRYFVAWFVPFLFTLAGQANAESCLIRDPLITPIGQFDVNLCNYTDPDDQISHLRINGEDIHVENEGLFYIERSKNNGILIFSRGAGGWLELDGGCLGSHLLLDLQKSPPKLYEFGVKGACNRLDEVLWKKRAAEINLKSTATFKYNYRDRVLLPPPAPDAKHEYWPYMGSTDESNALYARIIATKPFQERMERAYTLVPPYVREIPLNLNNSGEKR